MKCQVMTAMVIALVGLLAAGCATAPESSGERTRLDDDASAALQQAKVKDASLPGFLQTSAGYVVFPHVDKGAAGVGGSYGRGILYVGDKPIGYADVTQATIGLQAGAQAFREIMVFENKSDVERFSAGKLTLAANLSAVGLKTGAAESAQYTEGVAVFVDPIGGVMGGAACRGP